MITGWAVAACGGSPPKVATVDGGTTDASTSDARTLDARAIDARGADAAMTDGSSADSPSADALAPPTVDAGFPTIALSYLTPTTLTANAFSYQMADYDQARHQVLFYPYGSVTKPYGNSGVLLAYNVSSATTFTMASSWTTADVSQLVGPNAVNFGGGFLDTSDTHAYLPAGPGYEAVGDAAVSKQSLAMQWDLAKAYANPNDPTAYATMDLRTLPGIPNVGGFSGIFANGYAYLCPTIDSETGLFHGVLIRYDASGSFSDTSSWQWFNMNTIASPPDPDLGGMQSMAYVAPYVYLLPFANGTDKNVVQASKLVRYDTTKDFGSASSYETLDLTTLPVPSGIQPKLKGFTGGIVVGTRLVLVPWGLRNDMQTESISLLYDTTKDLTDPTAWEYLDLTTVNMKAGGYQFGWLDKHGYVWFVPTHNYDATSTPDVPPYVAWNTALPFASATSWTSYPNTVPNWLTGAAYDPSTDTAWLASYGTPVGGEESALLVQVQESY